MFSNDNLPEFCFKYYCKKCDYGTSKKSSYADHVLSAKHKKSMDCNEKLPKTCSDFVCKKCNKKYKDNSGLWRHKKKCNDVENISIDIQEIQKSNEIEELKAFMKYLMQENSEMKSMMLEQSTMMMEVIKNGTYNNNTISTNNSHNKAAL